MRIKIVSDPICPWCYVGYGRLRQALQQRPGLEVELQWLPFQLNPGMPAGGMDREAYKLQKFGSRERASQIYGAVEQAAAASGLEIHLDRITRTPSTFDAHRLLVFASGHQKATSLVEALFRRYFLRGQDIGTHEVLLDAAEEAGLDRKAAAATLASEEGSDIVSSADWEMRANGIQGVPFMIFNDQYALSGAQEPKTILPILDLGESGQRVA